MADYKSTLNLPQTGFEMRAGLAKKEPALIARWDDEKLYERIQEERAKAPLFVLHDGPPYANGHLHHGHVLNKILKDMVVKDRTMAGFRVPYVPGWDCHGLPIEVQVDKELGAKKAEMEKTEVRRECAAYAQRFIDIQRDEFRRLGVLGRWQKPYVTMDAGYEGETVRELAGFVEAGLLYKGLRPVNWCTVHRTALAEAEVEYEDHASPSIYVAFPLDTLPKGLEGKADGADLVIWTTTPWTLPANLAISLHPELEYVAYPVRGRLRIVAKELLSSFLTAIGEDEADLTKVAASWKGKELEGLTYGHPLFKRHSPVVLGIHVTLEAGTGCVHTAPGHGADDFDVGRRYSLEVLSPVDDAGRFTEAAGEFQGLKVFDANPKIVERLVEVGALLNQPGESIEHRYAHCWRCHKPIILRATEQWFVSMDKPFGGGGSLRERALEAIGEVRWEPSWGEDRIRGMLEARPDWCLSRQRTWGVPIPVIYCEKCQTPVLDARKMRKVGDIFSVRGSDAWFTLSVEELFGEVSCEKCGGTSFRKEEDILDVWFESGVSWAAVVDRERLGHRDAVPVDLYLEGSDQHRGWFHSSLLCSLATRKRPPFQQVLTHGFFVDGQGKKISKSKGNAIDPFVTINESGAELLRLWVAGEDYRYDIRISNEILSRLADTYRKLRNTVRYLLGNLYDFDPKVDAVAPEKMLPLDLYAAGLVSRASERAQRAYAGYNFHVVLQTVVELFTVELSAFYLDVLKDRLYASGPKSPERRSAQTALYLMARDMLRVLAPILSFTTEEAWSHLPKLEGDPESIHLTLYPGTGEDGWLGAVRKAAHAQEAALAKRFAVPREARKEALVALEQARKAKTIGSSTEAKVTLTCDAARYEALVALGVAELADLFIVSEVALEKGEAEGMTVEVVKATGRKCGRCWLYRADVGSDAEHPEVCGRCAEVL